MADDNTFATRAGSAEARGSVNLRKSKLALDVSVSISGERRRPTSPPSLTAGAAGSEQALSGSSALASAGGTAMGSVAFAVWRLGWNVRRTSGDDFNSVAPSWRFGMSMAAICSGLAATRGIK